MRHKRLFLDTCAFVWLVQGSDRLAPEVRDAIDAAEVVFVSAISAWEVAIKAARGGLLLPLEASEWFERALEVHDLVLYPLTVEVLVDSTRLPVVHRDPADRFVIASAMQENCPVVTADQKFAGYGIEIVF